MKKALNFKSKASYKKWLAYGHIHGVFKNRPGNTPVKIRGKAHKVVHVRHRYINGKWKAYKPKR